MSQYLDKSQIELIGWLKNYEIGLIRLLYLSQNCERKELNFDRLNKK